MALGAKNLAAMTQVALEHGTIRFNPRLDPPVRSFHLSSKMEIQNTMCTKQLVPKLCMAGICGHIGAGVDEGFMHGSRNPMDRPHLINEVG